MGKTSISWTDFTWNPWMGCRKVSLGCKNCFMFRDQKRYGNDPTEIRRSKTTFNYPYSLLDPHKIFVCSWSDFFLEEADEWRDDAWEIIRKTPHLTYQILTKRPERILDCLPKDFFPRNVWWGISAENQIRLDERWEILDSEMHYHNPAALFISAEPLLGPLDLSMPFEEIDLGDEDGPWWTQSPDWVIVGGESGPGYREMEIEWVREIQHQCKEFEVPLFVKQDSGPKPGMRGRIPDDLWIQEFPVIQSQQYTAKWKESGRY